MCGGAEVYRLLKDYVELLYCTRIHHTFEGDTYFPTDFPWGDFIKVKSIEGEVDEKNIYPHTFEIFDNRINISHDFSTWYFIIVASC